MIFLCGFLCCAQEFLFLFLDDVGKPERSTRKLCLVYIDVVKVTAGAGI